MSVVSKQYYQRYNVTARSRVSENTWNFATVNFASPVKQREPNKDIRTAKELNIVNQAFRYIEFRSRLVHSELTFLTSETFLKSHFAVILSQFYRFPGDMSDCELNVLINLDLIELNLEQVYIDSIQL